MIYKAIKAYTHVSGAHWDNVNGANMQGATAATVLNGANIQGATAATVFDALYITQKVWFLFYFIRYYLCDNIYVV